MASNLTQLLSKHGAASSEGGQPTLGQSIANTLGHHGDLRGKKKGWWDKTKDFFSDAGSALWGAVEGLSGASAAKTGAEMAALQRDITQQQMEMQKRQFERQDYPFRGEALRALQKRFQLGASPTLMQEQPSYFNALQTVNQINPSENPLIQAMQKQQPMQKPRMQQLGR